VRRKIIFKMIKLALGARISAGIWGGNLIIGAQVDHPAARRFGSSGDSA
jgi:hypothetical protein